MTLEGKEDLNIEFSDVIPRDSSEGSYGHVVSLIVREGLPSGPLRYTHFEWFGGFSVRVEGGG